jgi:fructose/tagatose bisphosphate aldolase
MAVATTTQVRELIDAAREGGYAYPAVDVSSWSTLNAAIRRFVEAGSDGIAQVSTGAGAYLYDGVLKVDGEVGDKTAYDPRVWGAAAEVSMSDRDSEACDALGSAGRALHRPAQVVG